MERGRRDRALTAAASAAVALHAFLLLIPLFALWLRFADAIARAPELSLSAPFAALRTTAALAASSCLVSLIPGVALGVALGSRSRAPSFALARAFLNFPFSVPVLAASLAWIALLGSHGLLVRWVPELFGGMLYSWWAVLVAQVAFNLPFAAGMVADARARVPHTLLETAASLGAGPMRRFQWHVWPRIRPAALLTALQIFQLCASSFALVQLLGGGVQTLETLTYLRVRSGMQALPEALAFAGLQIALNASVFLAISCLGAHRIPESLNQEKSNRSIASEGNSALHAPLHGPHLRGAGAPAASPVPDSSSLRTWILVALCAAPCLPYLALLPAMGDALRASRSFFTQELFPAALQSLGIAVGAAGVALLCAIGALHQLHRLRRRPVLWSLVHACATFPAALSLVALSLGWWCLLSYLGDPWDWAPHAVLLLQGTTLAPIAVRALLGLALTPETARLETARAFGAGPLRAWMDAEWPRWRRPFWATFALLAALSLGELAAIGLFASDSFAPMPVLIARLMGRYRFEEARVCALFLLAAAAVAHLLAAGSQSKEQL